MCLNTGIVAVENFKIWPNDTREKFSILITESLITILIGTKHVSAMYMMAQIHIF
jgi:hypothetical protein